MLIDTHAHIHTAEISDQAAILQRALAAGVTRVINIGYDLPSSEASLALAQQESMVYAAVGIQPHYALSTTSGDLIRLQSLLQQPRVVALGEIGLDYHHNRAPREDQEQLFRTQLGLARELDLPVVIHSRDAHQDTVRILADAAHNVVGVMHAFSGDWSYASECLELGFYISLAGPVTFKKATDLHEVAQQTPLDRLLIETDSPYLTPHPFRGKQNEPAYVRLVAEAIATLRGFSLAEVAAATTANAEALFRRLQ